MFVTHVSGCIATASLASLRLNPGAVSTLGSFGSSPGAAPDSNPTPAQKVNAVYIE